MDELPHLKAAREALTSRVMPAYPFSSDTYKRAGEAVDALDKVAEALTGDAQALRTLGMRMPTK